MKKSYLSRQEEIILSTVDIINEFGIGGLSIRELAKKENVTEGALYRHFKSKDDIIIEVLNFYSKYDNKIMNTIKNDMLESKAAVLFFIKSITEYYENYPEITAVACSYGSLLYEAKIKDLALQIKDNRFNFLKLIIKEGKAKEEIKSELNSEEMSDMILAYLNFIIFKWRTENYKFSLKDRVLNMVNIILNNKQTA